MYHGLHLEKGTFKVAFRSLVIWPGGPGRQIPFWAGLAIAGSLAAGCSGAPGPSSAMVRLSGAEIAVLTGSVNPADTAEVANAYEVLVQRCMQSKGLVYFPHFVTAADVSPPQQVPGVPGATISLAVRETGGYGFYSQVVQASANPGSRQGPDQEETYADSLTGAAGRRYRLALDGPDSQRINVTLPGGATASLQTGGCVGAASRQLYGSVANSAQVATGYSLLYDDLYNAVVSDPKFTAVVARWSSCMSGRGLKYSTPTALWNSLFNRIDARPTPAARDLEIRVAVADYRCAAAVNLVGTARRLENEHAQYIRRPLAQYLALITQVDTNAAKVAKSLNLPS